MGRASQLSKEVEGMGNLKGWSLPRDPRKAKDVTELFHKDLKNKQRFLFLLVDTVTSCGDSIIKGALTPNRTSVSECTPKLIGLPWGTRKLTKSSYILWPLHLLKGLFCKIKNGHKSREKHYLHPLHFTCTFPLFLKLLNANYIFLGMQLFSYFLGWTFTLLIQSAQLNLCWPLITT